MTASKLVPRKEKLGSYGLSKLFQISSTFLDVRLVIGVSIDIFLLFCCFFYNTVVWLNVSEFNRMYEILG